MTLTRQAITEAAKFIEQKGLTPLDLIEWTHLLDLHKCVVVKSGGLADGVDIHVHAQMRGEVIGALTRKAALLDQETNSNFHSDLLKAFGVSL